MTQGRFEGLTLLSSLLALKLAVSVKVKLLIFDYIVTRDIPVLGSAQVRLYALGVVAERSQKLLS